MLLRVFSNRFLRNHTGKVVPRIFPSCWKLSRFRPNPTWCVSRRGLKKIWGNFQTAAIIPIFERNEMTECPIKPRQPTSIGITWHIQPFSTQSARSVSKRFFFRSCASSRFSSQGTVNSIYIYIYIYIYGNNTRMLHSVFNNSRKQSPTKQQLYGHLPPISQTIRVRRTRRAGYCWRSKDVLL